MTVFCEDVRHELDGKLTCVGVFTTNIWVPFFPIVLPKLAILTLMVIPKSIDLSQFELLAHFPDDTPDTPRLRLMQDLTEIISADRKIESLRDPDVEEVNKLSQTAIFSPVELKAEGLIRVRARFGEVVVKAGTIEVRQALAPTMQSA